MGGKKTAGSDPGDEGDQIYQKNILSKFNIPRAFISDNETQFNGKEVKDLLEQLKIEFYNSMQSYPQCNGQAEATNKTIMNEIKKKA